MKPSKFGRIISGISGRERTTNKLSKSGGVYTGDQVFDLKVSEIGTYTGTIQSGKNRTTFDGWPRAGISGGNTISNTYQSISTIDPFYPSVLIHFDTFAPHNHIFRDYSGYNNDNQIYSLGQNQIPAVTRFSPIYTDWSTLFMWDGYYQVNDQANLRFGLGNFTVEFWMKSTAQRSYNQFIMSKGNAAHLLANTLGWSIYLNGNDEIVFFDGTASSQSAANIATTGANITRDTWTHVALQRSGLGNSQFQIFINGQPKANGILATNFNNTDNMYIARDRAGNQQLNGVQVAYEGFLTDIRIRNDAVYPAPVGSTFPIPNAPLDMANTSTVFAMPIWARNHLNIPTNHPTGSTVQAFNKCVKVNDSPFKNTTHATGHGAYSMYSYDGGRRYYYYDNGTGNGTSMRPTGGAPPGPYDWTIEGWVYAVPGQAIVVGSKGTNGGNGFAFYVTSGQRVQFETGTTITATSSSTSDGLAQFGAWNHIAMSHVGTSFTIHLNGQKVYTGSGDTNGQNASVPFILNGTRDSGVVGTGYVCGVRMSSNARYFASANFNVNSSSFVTQSCTPDVNTVFLTATSDAFKPFHAEPMQSVYGQARHIGLQYSGNDNRPGHRYYQSRNRTHSWAFWDQGSSRVIANTVNGDFSFGATQDFSWELWAQGRDDLGNNIQLGYLWDARHYWKDPALWCRWTGDAKKIEIGCNGRFVLSSSSNALREGGLWNHICVQRVNTAMALYVNGKKEDEVIYVQAIAATNNRITFGNAAYNKMDYGTNWTGKITDVRILKGSAAYAVANNNPEYIPVPRQPLANIANTVLLTLNREPLGDYSGRNNMVAAGGEANVANSDGYLTSSWSSWSGISSPYSPTDWDYTELLTDGMARDDVVYYLRGLRDSTDGTENGGGTPILSEVARFTVPWTIELMYWGKQADPLGMPNGMKPTDESGRALFRSASANNNFGVEFGYHWSAYGNTVYGGGNNGYSAWGDQTIRIWNPQLTNVVNNFSYSTYSNTGIQNTFKGHSINNLVAVYDPSKPVNFAMFLNGKRIKANTGIFNANTNSFVLPFSQNRFGMMTAHWNMSNLYGFRVSDNARYDTTSTTIPIMSPSTYVEDANTQVIYGRHSVITDKTLRGNWVSYNVFPNYTFKKYGDYSLKFDNRFTGNYRSNIQISGSPNYYEPRPIQIRRGDYTVECWASWLAANSGGLAISSNSNRHCLWHIKNYVYVGITDAGLWRLGFMNAAGDPSGSWTTDMRPFHEVNTSISAAQCWTGNPAAFDHICIVRKNMTTTFYVNGIEQGKMNDHNTQNWGTYTADASGPADTYYVDMYSQDSDTFMMLGSNWNQDPNYAWNGFVQDFRLTEGVRYKSRVINGVNTMVFADTNIPALPVLAAGPFPTR